MGNHYQLVAKLKELFGINKNSIGVKSVRHTGGVCNHVILELSEFLLGDVEFQKLIDAKRYAGASGFYTVPQGERESSARHYFVFYF